MYDTLYIEESLSKIIRMLADMNIQLKSIDNRLTSLEKKTNRQPLTEAETRFNLINTSLPIKTLQEITLFEDLITTNENAVLQFYVSGHLPKDNIYRVLTKVFDDSCAKQCSWKGRRNNFAVMKLKTINIIKDIICSSHAGVTDLDFESHGAEWFRFAKQRISRKGKNGQNP
ncbi:uncharacterized protein LOC125501870 [Athalia rosae]|uniref:uncharacterized protein LOC125501870 n=1 Tax=Athalia rosae TaxID=37344 RepID=UPI0020341F57|nr:uncharacterized protein LOC125501870 [Athalia rosae]